MITLVPLITPWILTGMLCQPHPLGINRNALSTTPPGYWQELYGVQQPNIPVAVAQAIPVATATPVIPEAYAVPCVAIQSQEVIMCCVYECCVCECTGVSV